MLFSSKKDPTGSYSVKATIYNNNVVSVVNNWRFTNGTNKVDVALPNLLPLCRGSTINVTCEENFPEEPDQVVYYQLSTTRNNEFNIGDDVNMVLATNNHILIMKGRVVANEQEYIKLEHARVMRNFNEDHVYIHPVDKDEYQNENTPDWTRNGIMYFKRKTVKKNGQKSENVWTEEVSIPKKFIMQYMALNCSSSKNPPNTMRVYVTRQKANFTDTEFVVYANYFTDVFRFSINHQIVFRRKKTLLWKLSYCVEVDKSVEVDNLEMEYVDAPYDTANNGESCYVHKPLTLFKNSEEISFPHWGHKEYEIRHTNYCYALEFTRSSNQGKNINPRRMVRFLSGLEKILKPEYLVRAPCEFMMEYDKMANKDNKFVGLGRGELSLGDLNSKECVLYIGKEHQVMINHETIESHRNINGSAVRMVYTTKYTITVHGNVVIPVNEDTSNANNEKEIIIYFNECYQNQPHYSEVTTSTPNVVYSNNPASKILTFEMKLTPGNIFELVYSITF